MKITWSIGHAGDEGDDDSESKHPRHKVWPQDKFTGNFLFVNN